MKKKQIWVTALVLGILFLHGCSSNSAIISKNEVEYVGKKEIKRTQEIILHVEDTMRSTGGASYQFTGFINENTIAFEETVYDDPIYHPAEVGYRFKFRYSPEIKEVEILEVNRMEGIIKIKTTTTNE